MMCANVDSCPHDAENDVDRDLICGDIDSCAFDAKNDADSDSFCVNVDCLDTCYGENCDYWVVDQFMACSVLEDSYGCNCDGCDCAEPLDQQCENTCWDYS